MAQNKKCMILIDEYEDKSIVEMFKPCYRLSSLIPFLQEKGYELYHNDKFLIDELNEYGIKYSESIDDFKLYLFTHNTHTNRIDQLVKIRDSGKKFKLIFEDADVDRRVLNYYIKNDLHKNTILYVSRGYQFFTYFKTQMELNNTLIIPFLNKYELFNSPIPKKIDKVNDLCILSNPYYSARVDRVARLEKSVHASKYKIFLAGKDWDQKIEFNNIKYIGYGDLYTDTRLFNCRYGLIDLKDQYYRYKQITPKVTEYLELDILPIFPRIPIVETVFDKEISEKLTYRDEFFVEDIKVILDYDEEVREYLLKYIKDLINEKYSIEVINRLIENSIKGSI